MTFDYQCLENTFSYMKILNLFLKQDKGYDELHNIINTASDYPCLENTFSYMRISIKGIAIWPSSCNMTENILSLGMSGNGNITESNLHVQDY